MRTIGMTVWLFVVSVGLYMLSLGCVDRREPQNVWTKQTKQVKQLPTMKYRLGAVLSSKRGSLRIHGVNVSPWPLKRGQKAKMTFYYRANKRIQAGWKYFLHLQSGAGSQGFRNLDQGINAALPPLTQLRPGALYSSSFHFRVPRDMTGSKLYFYMGIWHLRRGRMKVTGAKSSQNRLLLAAVPTDGKGPRALPPRPVYVAHRTNQPPTIDGVLNDPVWKHARSTGPWHYYNYQRKPRLRTEAKLAWDNTYLYVAIICEDDDIWGTYKKRDNHLWKQENIELFVDANRDKKGYAELQVSPAGVIFDTFFTSHRRPRPIGILNYDSGMIVKVKVDGTLNNKRDKDKRWVVEMKLPLKNLAYRQSDVRLPPADGDEWLINFFRIDKSRRRRVYEDQSWSPPFTQRSGDYHNLYRFGTLRFSTRTLGQPTKRVPARRITKRVVPVKQPVKRPAPRKRLKLLLNNPPAPSKLRPAPPKVEQVGAPKKFRPRPTVHKPYVRELYRQPPPAVRKTAASKPAVRKPATRKPVARKPTVRKPAARKPAASRPTSRPTKR